MRNMAFPTTDVRIYVLYCNILCINCIINPGITAMCNDINIYDVFTVNIYTYVYYVLC